MMLHALSKELEMEPTKASRLLTKLGYGSSLPTELDGDMELHLRSVNDMLNRGFTINDAVGVVKRQIDGLDADDPEEPPPPPVRLSTIPGPKKKRGRPKGAKNKSWADICWENELRRWSNPNYPLADKIEYLEKQVFRTKEQEELLTTMRRQQSKEAFAKLQQYNLPSTNTKWEAMGKAVEETVDKAPKGAPEDTKEGLKQLLLDICLNLVSQQDARSFEANKERCLSLLRRNNAGQSLTVN